MNKTEDDDNNLIEEMTFNNYQWPGEREQPKMVRGKIKVNALNLLLLKWML